VKHQLHLNRQGVMTSLNRPLVEYSEVLGRATIFDPHKVETESEHSQEYSQESVEEEEEFYSDQSFVDEKPNKKQPNRKKLKKLKKKKGINIVSGHIYLKVAGYEGKQRLSAAQLVQYIPLKNLKKYAIKVLKNQGLKPKRLKKKRKSVEEKINYFSSCPPPPVQ